MPANLSLRVFNYVVNSGEPVVLENACRDSQFGAEAYLNEHQVGSVLCLPVYYKGELDLVLYLENNLVRGCLYRQSPGVSAAIVRPYGHLV